MLVRASSNVFPMLCYAMLWLRYILPFEFLDTSEGLCLEVACLDSTGTNLGWITLHMNKIRRKVQVVARYIYIHTYAHIDRHTEGHKDIVFFIFRRTKNV